MSRPFIVGVTFSWMGHDPARTIYNGRPLLYLEQSLTDWLLRHDLVPVVIPYPTPGAPVDIPFDPSRYMERVDALVLQGGIDISPNSYGEQPLHPDWEGDAHRDRYELSLIDSAVKLDKPVLGICRGHQLLNVAFGGSLYQDIPSQLDHALGHRNAEVYERNFHEATLQPGSWLSKLYDGQHRVRINSVHHQAVKDLGEGLVVQARSTEDDVVEAFRLDPETNEGRWVVGVQWHPEFQDPRDDALLSTRPLVDELKRAIEARHQR